MSVNNLFLLAKRLPPESNDPLPASRILVLWLREEGGHSRGHRAAFVWLSTLTENMPLTWGMSILGGRGVHTSARTRGLWDQDRASGASRRAATPVSRLR